MGLAESTDIVDEHWKRDRDDSKQHAQPASSTQNDETALKKKKREIEIEKEEVYVDIDEDALREEKMWIDAIAQEPKSSHLRNQLANHYFSHHRLNEAEFQYNAAIQLDAVNAIAHYDYAFMRHHQFYWALAKLQIKDATRYATEAKAHYHEVLKLQENDVETHYQLSLLYLTCLETTLIQSIDQIQSPLSVASVQCLHADICSTQRPIPSPQPLNVAVRASPANNTNTDADNDAGDQDDEDEDETSDDAAADDDQYDVNYYDYPIGRGMYSAWYADRVEIHSLCARHLEITMESCTDMDPVLFGTYITSSRLLYIECIAPFSFKYSREEKIAKLNKGVAFLQAAMHINEHDATLHHDLALLLSHELVHRYSDAIYHWQVATKLDGNNAIYYAQIAYIYQYYLQSFEHAMKFYHVALSLKPNSAQIWNNLGILNAQFAKSQHGIVNATKCWTNCLSISPTHCEAHRNLGNIQWLHYYDTHKGEVHLQRAIAISSQVYHQLNRTLHSLRDELQQLLAIKPYLWRKNTLILSKLNVSTNAQPNDDDDGDDDDDEDSDLLTHLIVDIKHNEALRHKFGKFLAQSKSDYGGLLLMMFKYDAEAEKELTSALQFDAQCISAHYYLGKHLYDTKQDYAASLQHLQKYIDLEMNKNTANRAHAQQILGQIHTHLQQFAQAKHHFGEAIKLSTTAVPTTTTATSENADQQQQQQQQQKTVSNLPVWAQCKIHCGFADAIVKQELNALYDEYGSLSGSAKAQRIINALQSKPWLRRGTDSKEKSSKQSTAFASPVTAPQKKKSKDEELEQYVTRLASNLEIAKKHYRLILKLDNKYVASPLGLGCIFGKFEGKSIQSDRHYSLAIRLCQDKLIKLYEKYEIEVQKQNFDKQQQDRHRKQMIEHNIKLSLQHQSKIAQQKPYLIADEQKSELDGDGDGKEKESNDSNQPIASNVDAIAAAEEPAMAASADDHEVIVQSKDENRKKKFSDLFNLNLSVIEKIMAEWRADKETHDISVIRIVKEMKECILYCIEAHLGKVDIILQLQHNNKWKEALAHCVKILYLDEYNVVGHTKKALLLYKLNQKEKAFRTAQYALRLAKEFDVEQQTQKQQQEQICPENNPNFVNRNRNNKKSKTNYVKHNLHAILKQAQTEIVSAKSPSKYTDANSLGYEDTDSEEH